MSEPTLTGSRIRARRLDAGLRQSALAEACGISPSYLNLIEHNRRRIGGKLLNRIAAVLDVEPHALSEGADLALMGALREAAEAAGVDAREAARAEEVAGRFPGWASLVAGQARRIGDLERTVAALNDRLESDPVLSAALYDLLSTVTAIRSTASILAGDQNVDPEWQARFLRNIFEDSRRLAEASDALVAWLDADASGSESTASPQEEVEVWLAGTGWHIAELEGDGALSPEDVVDGADGLSSTISKQVALEYARKYRADAGRMPLSEMERAISETGLDPAALAERFSTDLGAVFRRLASLPGEAGADPVGLAVCDASGALTFRKPIPGFPLPRFGSACPLLPLYQALSRPMSPVRAVVEQAGREGDRFLTFSIAQPARPARFDGPPVIECSMLILPDREGDETSIPIGGGCRVCPREGCIARREPSIL